MTKRPLHIHFERLLGPLTGYSGDPLIIRSHDAFAVVSFVQSVMLMKRVLLGKKGGEQKDIEMSIRVCNLQAGAVDGVDPIASKDDYYGTKINY